MANRHLSRSVVLQTLFEWDFNGNNDFLAQEILNRNSVEFAPGVGDEQFMDTLLNGIFQKQKELDTIITKAAPDWPIEKISLVDRNVLRIGLFELLFSDRKEVPAKVAINEAIELAKSFGGETSGKFVNGVLGAVYKELGEPGKDDVSPKKKEEVPFEKMAIEEKAGAVVYAWHGDDLYFALLHDVFGHWTLTKGSPEKGESLEEAAIREAKEEMDVDITSIKEKLGHTEYVANHPEKGKHRKQVTYFLAEAKFGDLKLGESGGLDDVKWFKAKDIVDLNFYNDIVPLVTKAIGILLKK
ncbi:transcription antitermination factor NusB [Candidatus Nomurabacteria bacterium]|nr:transcription antitermination factor NusB [Candidatus Nomurabacteria bacterium]